MANLKNLIAMKFKKILENNALIALIASALYAAAFTLLGGNKDGRFVPYFDTGIFVNVTIFMYMFLYVIPVSAIYLGGWLREIAVTIPAVAFVFCYFLLFLVEPLDRSVPFISIDTLMMFVFFIAYVICGLLIFKLIVNYDDITE